MLKQVTEENANIIKETRVQTLNSMYNLKMKMPLFYENLREIKSILFIKIVFYILLFTFFANTDSKCQKFSKCY